MEGKPLASNGNKPGSNGGRGHETKSQKAWQLRLKAEKNTKEIFCNLGTSVITQESALDII